MLVDRGGVGVGGVCCVVFGRCDVEDGVGCCWRWWFVWC